ncbi:MAG: hypothetical protein IJY14_03090 [Acholeplasmatales bacterium]|nr:hypothetical protein [Acholeplasmatales bacterium]
MYYYLIGIKGSGMSALAKVLLDDGHNVTGADELRHYYTEDGLNVKIDSLDNIPFNKDYIYIIGNAYINHNATNKIIKDGLSYYTYPDFLNSYFSNYKIITVSGSHGKTTTTKMLAHLCEKSSYIIGDGSGKGGNNNVFILEACEYRNTFLSYKPNIAILLNIDYDHPDFFKNEDEYIKSFKEFISNSNLVIANGDDDNILKINTKNMILYGMNENNDIRFKSEIINDKTRVYLLGEEYTIPTLGIHYVYDFVGALLASKYLGISSDITREKIKDFVLPKRRLETKEYNKSILIHDYAHHPKEIECVHDTLRLKYPNYKINCIFEPHTLSRSIGLKDEFKKALSLFDDVYLLPIFTSVREIKNIALENQIYEYWGYKRINESFIKRIINDNQIYAFLGAGDINEVFLKVFRN